MVLSLMHFSFSFYNIILMRHSLSVVTFLVVSNGNTSWDFETQYLAPEQCAESLACLSVYAAVTFASRFQTRNSVLRTFPLASSYCMLYKYFKVHMTKMSHNDLSIKLSCIPFQKKKKRLASDRVSYSRKLCTNVPKLIT